MLKVTWKGLIAHKLRFVLTGIAVILGVAFISGTFVFTATIQQTFDDLIANIYKGTDAQVRGPEAFKNNQGGPGAAPRPPVPASVEQVVYHIHSHLQVYADGQPRTPQITPSSARWPGTRRRRPSCRREHRGRRARPRRGPGAPGARRCDRRA